MSIMQKKQWNTGRKRISLMLACVLIVSMIPWGNFSIKAATDCQLTIQAGDGTLSDIKYVKEGETDVINGTPGEGGISGIPVNASVTFSIIPASGKYLEKIEQGTQTVPFTQEGDAYQATVTVADDMTLVCTYGTVVSGAQPESYFSVKTTAGDGTEIAPYFANGVYYAGENGFLLYPESGIGLKFGDETDYSNNKRTYAEDTTIQNFSVEKTGDSGMSYEKVTLAAGVVLKIDKSAPEITGITFSGIGTSESEWNKDSVVPTKYGYYFKDSTTVKVQVKDGLSGVESISYELEDIAKPQVSGTCESLTKENGEVYGTFPVPADFKGHIYVYAADNVGNNCDREQPDGVIVEGGDTHGTNAAIQINLPDSANKDGNNNPVYNKEGIDTDEIEIDLKIKDSYSGIKSISWKLENGAATTTKTIQIDNQGNIMGDDADKWGSKLMDKNLVTELSSSVKVSEEGNGIVLTVTMTDRTGHELSKNVIFSIDTTPPEITGITFSGDGMSESEWSKDSVEVTTYGYYFKDTTMVKVQAKDGLSGVKSISYRLVDINPLKQQISGTVASSSLTEEGDGVYGTFPVPAGFKGYIYVSATDNVNNSCKEKQPDGVIVEDEDTHGEDAAIQITLPASANKDGNNNSLYNEKEIGTEGIEIGLGIKDSYSGIKSVSWKLENGDTTVTKTIQIDNQKTITGDDAGSWTSKSEEENLVTELSSSIKVSEEGNEIVLTVTMTDRTGRELSKNVTFAIDTTIPTITASCNPAGWTSGNVTALFTPSDEAGSGIAGMYYAKGNEITENGTKVEAQSGTYSKQFTEESDEGAYVCWTVDRAGNVSEKQPFSVKIDRTKPRITGITFSGQGTSEQTVLSTDYGYYFKNSTQVTVQASDEKQGGSCSGVKAITYSTVDIDGTKKENTVAANGNQITFTVPANFKGHIYAKAIDEVENIGIETQPGGVIVENADKHKDSASIQINLPETAYSDDKGLKLYNHDIEIPVTVADTFSGVREIKWSIKSDADSGSNQNGTIEVSNGGGVSGDTNDCDITKTDSNLVTEMKKTLKVFNNSNEITLNITLTDRVGFTTEEEVKFSIDKTQPVISVKYNTSDSPSTSSDKNYKEFYKNEREAVITVKERNFNEEKANLIIEKTLKSTENVTISKWQSKDQLSGKSDEAVHTCTVTYQGNSAYNFSMAVTDLAGNETKYHKDGTSDIFMVDKKKPTLNKNNLKISPKNSDTAKQYTDDKGIVWYNQNVTFSFTAKDVDAGLYQVSSSAFAMDGILGKFSKHVNVTYGLKDYSVQEVDYGKRGEEEEQSYTVSTNTKKNKSEKYKLAVNAVDYAGNESSMESKVIGIDTQKPRITGITFEGVGNQDSSWKGNTTVDEKDYGYYFREAATVKITATDASANGSSGLKSISYCLSDINDKAELKYIKPKLHTDEAEPYITVTIPKGFKGQIYAYATDNVGNQGKTEQPDGTIRESSEQADEAKIEISSPATSYQDEDGRPLYASDTTFHILAEDIYSGIQKVEWTVVSSEDADSNQSGMVEIDSNGSLSDSGWKITGTDENLVTRLERSITVSNNSNNIEMKVTLTDRAGNVTEYNNGNGMVFSIDKTAPKIEVSYLENDPSNERYYNKDRTATITVTERNFDEETTNRLIQIMNTDAVIPAYGAWTHGGEKGTDRATHTCTITYAADGDYTFTMASEDTAKNRAEYQNADEFTIDKTNPVIDVSYSTDGLSNAIYYKDTCVATITVTEHNFEQTGVVITQTAELDGQTVAAPVNTGWSSNGDVHTATINYNSDGDFTLNVACQDLAANDAENYAGTKFVVDLTEPEIEITDIEDLTAYNGAVTPGVSFRDVNCDTESVRIILSGYKHDPQDLTGSMAREVHGGSIKLDDFAHTAEVDDVYTLTAQVTDLAGNSKEVSKVFSVNRFGSNYILGDDTQQLVSQYYSNHEEDLVIREVNVSSLENGDVTYSRDGEIVTLEKGKDYDVVDEGTEYASWKEYTYTIHADNFTEEGAYMVTVLSVDGAENSMTNRTAKTKEYTKEVEFVIDKTAPTSVISGVDNNGRYTEAEREIKIDSQDNVAIDTVEVYLNDKGTPVLTWTQEELKENDGIMSYALQAASYWQNLRVVAVDKAGNRSESDTIRWLLTTNILVQFLNNPFLLFGTGILIVAAAGFGYWLIVIKRRKKNREEK